MISLLWCNKETLGIRLSSVPVAGNREATTALLVQGQLSSQRYTTKMLSTGWQHMRNGPELRDVGDKKKNPPLPLHTHTIPYQQEERSDNPGRSLHVIHV